MDFLPIIGKGVVSIGLAISMYLAYKVVQKRKKNNKEIRKAKKLQKEKEEEEKKIKNEIELLKKSKEEKEVDIQIMREQLNDKMRINVQDIMQENNDILKVIEKEDVKYKKEEIQKEINENYLKLHQLELDKKNIFPKLENLIHIEEELIEIEETEKVLIEKNNSIELAKGVIEEAYKKMKENITPKFSQELSETIYKISGGKYKKVKMNEDNNLVVELENGSYAPIDVLSIGTIDQLYLALRIAILRNIAEEKLPIIFDETFVYYDKERLKNTFEFMNKEIKNQIILFSCTDREEKILNEMQILFNKIKI